MREMDSAEDIDKAQAAVGAFELDYGTKYPKAVANITDDLDVLLELYRYPAEHWVHLRTTNHRVHLCRRATASACHRGPGITRGRNCLGLQAHQRRASPLAQVNAPELAALVRVGAVFHKGELLERPTDITPEPSTTDPKTAGTEVT
jgi:putative transposase